MKKEILRLTTAQFAKLHQVNKRTLHYYDGIGLFSPKYKGENDYRYYDYSQSMDFEFIRMLKEINLSIREIKELVQEFHEEKFLETMEMKQKEIDEKIKTLRRVKSILSQKQEQLLFCRDIKDLDIRVVNFKKEDLLTAPYKFESDDFMEVFRYVQDTWTPEQYRNGIGSYISLEKAKAGQFENYDGLYSPVLKREKSSRIIKRPGGAYLCGYLRGPWSRLSVLYEKMFDYASEHSLQLVGYAYEKGINDFMICGEEDYVTQVAVKIQDELTVTRGRE